MIKAIVYHKIEEKALLEKELMAAIPEKERMSASIALMDIFSFRRQRSKRGDKKTMIGEKTKIVIGID